MASPILNGTGNKTNQILRVGGTVLALMLLVYLLSQQGWGEIRDAVSEIPAWRLALAMLFMLISRFMVTGRWYVLLRSGGIPIHIVRCAQITFAGLFASNFLPTTIGGDVIRLAGAIHLKLDAAVSTASLVVDRLIGMAGMAMAVPFGLPSFLQSGILNVELDPTTLLAAGLPAPLMKIWAKLWGKAMRLVQKVTAALALWMRQPKALLASLVFTWVHMLCLFGVLYVLLAGMGEPVPYLMVAGLYSIVYFITLLPVSVNGYGIQEISMTMVFSTLGGASISASLTAALLFRTIMMVASLPGAAFVPGLLVGARTPVIPEPVAAIHD